MPHNTFGILKDKEETNALYEVTDQAGHLLMAMPWPAIVRQQLPFRLVCLALRGQGTKVESPWEGTNKRPRAPKSSCSSPDKTLFLRKRPGLSGKKTDTLLGLCLEPVLAGEARVEAALRALQQETLLPGLLPQELARTTLPEWLPAHISLFAADLPPRIVPESTNLNIFLEVDEDELAGLIATAPEKLGPEVLWAAQAGKLFTMVKE